MEDWRYLEETKREEKGRKKKSNVRGCTITVVSL
jgi:hypothetical protein